MLQVHKHAYLASFPGPRLHEGKALHLCDRIKRGPGNEANAYSQNSSFRNQIVQQLAPARVDSPQGYDSQTTYNKNM